jgi:hypothetical protein
MAGSGPGYKEVFFLTYALMGLGLELWKGFLQLVS